jgi:hypothetical protein
MFPFSYSYTHPPQYGPPVPQPGLQNPPSFGFAAPPAPMPQAIFQAAPIPVAQPVQYAPPPQQQQVIAPPQAPPPAAHAGAPPGSDNFPNNTSNQNGIQVQNPPATDPGWNQYLDWEANNGGWNAWGKPPAPYGNGPRPRPPYENQRPPYGNHMPRGNGGYGSVRISSSSPTILHPKTSCPQSQPTIRQTPSPSKRQVSALPVPHALLPCGRRRLRPAMARDQNCTRKDCTYFHELKLRRPCRFFHSKTDYCRDGDSCLLDHQEARDAYKQHKQAKARKSGTSATGSSQPCQQQLLSTSNHPGSGHGRSASGLRTRRRSGRGRGRGRGRRNRCSRQHPMSQSTALQQPPRGTPPPEPC